MRADLQAASGYVCGTAWAADGRTLAVILGGGTVEVWDAEAGRKLYTLSTGGYAPDAATFSPDGRRLVLDVSRPGPRSAVAGRLNDRHTEVVAFDLASGAEVLTLTGLPAGVQTAAFGPDGSRMATADGDGKAIKIWDAATGQGLLTLPGVVRPHTLLFAPNGRRLVAANGDGVTTFDATPLADGP